MKFQCWQPLLIVMFFVLNQSSGREWTEKASGVKIQADYVSSDETSVTVLHKGRRIPIQLSRLSDDDLAFIEAKKAEAQKADLDVSKGPYKDLIKGEFTHSKQALAENGLPFWIHADRKLTKGKETFPLVIVLHGRRNNAKPNEEFKVQGIATPFAKDENQKKNPSFVVQPYYPPQGGWEKIPEQLDATIDHLVEHLPIDTKRIYLMGFSNGAQGTFQALARHPDKFAGAITVAGPVGINSVVGKIKSPIRAWVGENDEPGKRDRTIALAKALKEDGIDIEWVVVKGAGHSCHGVPLKDPAIHKWLFSQEASN